jgi:predicted kinase
VIVFVNGAFGIGKTTVARELVRRLPRAVLYDPEWLGIAMQRAASVFGSKIDDFQDVRLWRRLTIAGLRIAQLFFRNVVVPMAFSNAEYLDEIRAGVEPHGLHFCLVAPPEVVEERLRARVHDATAWTYQRAAECCAVHPQPAFATHVDARRSVSEIAEEILRAARASPVTMNNHAGGS